MYWENNADKNTSLKPRFFYNGSPGLKQRAKQLSFILFMHKKEFSDQVATDSFHSVLNAITSDKTAARPKIV